MENVNVSTDKNHKVMILNRKNLEMTGIKDVDTFDEKEVRLITWQGIMEIKGKNLHMKRLSLETGEIDIEGVVDSLYYQGNSSDKDKDNSFLSKLFR